MLPKKNITVIISIILNLLIILILLLFKSVAENRLERISGMLERLGNADIEHIVHVEDTLIIATSFAIEQSIPVIVKMKVKYDLPFKTQIPIDQKIETPIKITVNESIHVDTAFLFKNKIIVPVDELIYVDQKFTIPTNKKKKQGIKIPIVAEIPLKQNITLDIKDPINTIADIPVKIPISETIPVKIEMTVPVDIQVPIDIPVNSEAMITFPCKLPVTGKIPLNLNIPVKIPLSSTPIKTKADSIALELRNLLNL